MTYITYAPVDRQFVCLERDLPPGAPFNGVDPLDGITFGFALQSRYPLAAGVPDVRFGTLSKKPADNPAILLRAISKAEYDAAYAAEMAARDLPAVPITSADVDAERDRRTAAGFAFNGVRFQSRPQDRENIMGAFALASAALTVGGKQPGDLRWHGGQSDFVFIAEDDSRMPMDAVAVLGLGQTAAAQKSALTFAANDLKKLDPIPADFADDGYWPPR